MSVRDRYRDSLGQWVANPFDDDEMRSAHRAHLSDRDRALAAGQPPPPKPEDLREYLRAREAFRRATDPRRVRGVRNDVWRLLPDRQREIFLERQRALYQMGYYESPAYRHREGRLPRWRDLGI